MTSWSKRFMAIKLCSALKVEITNDSGSVCFACPKCGEAEIVRSSQARKIGAKYTCSNCGFEGPN